MPAPAALAAARVALRHRRALAAGLLAVAGAWTVVVSAVVVAVGGGPPPAGAGDDVGIPPVALDAYRRAAEGAAGCGLRWEVLAALGQVESAHAAGREIAPDGTVAPPVLGPVLDGTAGGARAPDTDGGRLDGDAVWDRAVGPLQFLPATWARVGRDGDGDGRADPHHFHDAAAGAAALLCAAGPLTDQAALRAALSAYNRDDAYVAEVLGWIRAYEAAATRTAGETASAGTIVAVRGIQVDRAIATDLEALLAAAAADGVVLGGAGYRSLEEQVALRRVHCGTSHHAIWEAPAAACRPPTARPGESLHQAGLAVDFTCAGGLIASAASPCFAWLAAHAPAYGLRNLPSEPWHWSTTGR